MTRPSIDQTLMDVAHVWSRRSVCSRRQVGAAIARDGKPISQGYNGPARGEQPCVHPDDAGCRVSIHAEANALINAAYNGHSTRDAVLFVTCAPCYDCAGLIINAGIQRVAYAAGYRTEDGLTRLRDAAVKTELQEAKQ